eukprot:CAMPEP_0175845612 /NCGR_PEP_ID=MMETSP0107_2-20121207/22319_1 /TAXON_ID=195067 ORGANISM="Goniomonas pacifica, Strain CCMP1869" /NCGR_SAMPLE_ID=MMETSP0107_2 /ASSEMBLY_ACC=CAM_ASM_000203 /LENGTH=95 /DNA_ID=CAMNT_0017160185 /DNA_START=202 /DNA_END=489 /DNA_ORIENTATION=-
MCERHAHAHCAISRCQALHLLLALWLGGSIAAKSRRVIREYIVLMCARLDACAHTLAHTLGRGGEPHTGPCPPDASNVRAAVDRHILGSTWRGPA